MLDRFHLLFFGGLRKVSPVVSQVLSGRGHWVPDCQFHFRFGVAPLAMISAASPDLLPPSVYTLKPRIAPWSIVHSLLIPLGTGVIFGLYPARKAALTNPIEALRHE